MSALLEQVAVVPDSIEPYVGWKQMGMVGSQLLSPHNCVFWPHKQPFEARCSGRREWQPVKGAPRVNYAMLPAYGTLAYSASVASSWETEPERPKVVLPNGYSWSYETVTHPAPDESCSCGIYAADTRGGTAMYRSSGSVLVEVSLWGKVVIGDHGARAQYAYPKRIIAPKHRRADAEKAGELYGVPVEIESNSRSGDDAKSKVDRAAVWIGFSISTVLWVTFVSATAFLAERFL